jgi:hypothetical protein
MLRILLLAVWLLIFGSATAQDAPPQAPEKASDHQEPPQKAPDHKTASAGESGGVKTMSGMSVLGNEEAPKSLVIVPWKSSLLGDEVGVADSMDDRARPVDKEVFMREVHYYDLRSGAPKDASETH